MPKSDRFQRRASFLLPVCFAAFGCGKSDPPPPPADTFIELSGFDVAEKGWGDAPLPVHYVWSIKSNAPALTCKLDLDGDGAIDREIANCRADTTKDALGDLPTFTFEAIGE